MSSHSIFCFYGVCVLKVRRGETAKHDESSLDAQFLGQHCEIFRSAYAGPSTLSSVTESMMSVMNAAISSIAHKVRFLSFKDFKNYLNIVK